MRINSQSNSTDDGEHIYDSGELEVDEPLFGARDTYKGVTIRVFYLLRKNARKLGTGKRDAISPKALHFSFR